MDPQLRRTLNGVLAGSTATALWAAQQPLDMRVFGVPYSDTELLGKAITRAPAWKPLGVAMHVLGGAVFGGIYANVADRLPVPAHLRGPVMAMAEHLGSWPLTRFLGLHPAARDLPRLWGDHAAFAQATWRHLLLGVVCGEIELHLNRRVPAATDQAPPPAPHSVNGHHAEAGQRLAGHGA